MKLNKDDIKWWLRHIPDGYNDLERPDYSLEIFSDVSLTGWGAVCDGKRCNGYWTVTERKNHINLLELKDAFFGLKYFANNLKDVNIILRIENTTSRIRSNQIRT